MGRIWKHFKTITYHKYLVAQGCFQVGLYRQGLLHDLSKYSPSEFWVGVRYFQGDRSPNNAEREDIGYSSAWLHHKGRNKHHYEYWNDYSCDPKAAGSIVPVPMPDRYIAEMIMDRIAACKVYRGKDYTDADPLNYYYRGTDKAPLHDATREKLERMLRLLAQKGEKETFRCIRRELVRGK
ncbi:MAG: catalase [Lachnospiraceae bacterium]|nr:catalase [Lachnospiraceae bacterium]